MTTSEITTKLREIKSTLSDMLDDTDIPIHHDDAMLIAKDIDTLYDAIRIVKRHDHKA